MQFKILHIQKDTSTDCYSVLTVTAAKYFVEYIQPVHEEKGKLEEQRDVLTTRSAKIIRHQMVEDLEKGGILPPIVLGRMYTKPVDNSNFHELINYEEIYILDGMQRIQALRDARDLADNLDLRVEFWFAPNETALLYRMLVLNSGQVPWSINKQIEVVFKPVIETIKHKIENTQYDEYKQTDIIELFLAFTSRKVKIDKRQQLAEYHSALDIMGILGSGKQHALEYFIEVFKYIVLLDQLFSEAEHEISISDRYIFNSQTARVGFTVSCAEKIYGLLGNHEERDFNKVNKNFNFVCEFLEKLTKNINQSTTRERIDFLELETLKAQLRAIPQQRHRQAFSDSFKGLFQGDDIKSFAVCWNRMS
ncbi:MAG: hypothetical protein ACO3Z2_08130 [Chitinophagaceae bacterium]